MHLIDVNKAAKYFKKHIFMITDKFAVCRGCVLCASEEQLFKLRCKLEVPELEYGRRCWGYMRVPSVNVCLKKCYRIVHIAERRWRDDYETIIHTSR